MRLVRYRESMLGACAEFWWSIYEHMPYVHRPDGGVTINTPPIGPEYFARHLKAGFNGAHYWTGNITDDSVILVEDEGKMSGILVCSIDAEKATGNILSCYVHRDHHGREITDILLNEVLELFRRTQLHRAVAGPNASRTLEVECPIHLALLDVGFSWENSWDPAHRDPEYEVFLGGALEDFHLRPEINEKREKLYKEGIQIKRVTVNETTNLQRIDTGDKPSVKDYERYEVTFVAFVDGLAVGWLHELGTWTDDYDRVMAWAVPEVIPSYRRKGIGKVLYHLGIEDTVRQGAKYGWTVTNIHNPARLIYQSVGFRYWYTSFSRMSRRT